MLKPGGKLLFNAPNALACWLKGQLWIDFAPPPDVVTLYEPGFWTRFFSDEAFVTEEIENCPADYSLRIWLRKYMYRWRPPRTRSLNDGVGYYRDGPPQEPGALPSLRSAIEKGVLKIGFKLGAMSLVPSQAAPFGLYVTLTKK